ncbi:hypothetical protein [Pseudoduganella namucuonensis]|nr:hypothetical protein [Pseudoduganella namucuonensis]
MDNFAQALYALKRQRIAVERTLGAGTTEECVVASRWVTAWQKLVQARLDQDLASPVQNRRFVDRKTGQYLH